MAEEKKSLSEAAQWFLSDFQRILNEFSEERGVQGVATNREGSLITELQGVQHACKFIIATEEGRMRCKDHFKIISLLAKTQKKPIFIDCYAGFISTCIPIMIGEAIGTLISCGERYDRGESEEKLIEKFSKLANELGILDRGSFLRAVINEVKLVIEEDVQQRTKILSKLVEILVETANTPLKEVFW
jgi:ligand-binding sensor protein